MNVYLKHPVHGTKVAINEMEVQGDENNGWVRYNPEAPVVEAKVAEPVVEDAPVEAPVNELDVKRRRKV